MVGWFWSEGCIREFYKTTTRERKGVWWICFCFLVCFGGRLESKERLAYMQYYFHTTNIEAQKKPSPVIPFGLSASPPWHPGHSGTVGSALGSLASFPAPMNAACSSLTLSLV